METENQVCLKWDSFQSSLTSRLGILWEEDSFCDVTLFCEGQEIRAHKIILSACSLTFKSLLKNNTCKHPIVILHGVKMFVLEAILQFIYKGEVNIEQDQLDNLLRTASSLQIKGLAGVTDEEIDKMEPENLSSNESNHNEYCNIKNHRLGPIRKKPKISLPKENEETCTLVTPKEEPFSENEFYNTEFQNSDEESEDLNDLARKEIVDCNVDPLVMNPCADTPQEDAHSMSELNPNASQGFTCSNVQFLPYPCPFCSRAYASWGFRRRHIKALHTGSPKLTCKWCNIVLDSTHFWENHVINEHHLTRSEAEQGLKVLEEARMVLQTSNQVTVNVVKEDAGRLLTKK